MVFTQLWNDRIDGVDAWVQLKKCLKMPEYDKNHTALTNQTL